MVTAESASTPILSLRNVTKSFGGPPVLSNVNLDVYPGEIHGLVGQNGSGKSTLVKILAGYHAPESHAELVCNGRSIRLPLAPDQFRTLGFSFVHQNLGLAGDLSVVDNMRIGMYRRPMLRQIKWRDERNRTADAISRFNLDVGLDELVGDLPEASRAILAIARAVQEIEEGAAIHGHRGLLVLDEPTPYLAEKSVEALFTAMRRVASEGTACLFVSHRLDEIHKITDRVTVLRDGNVVTTARSADLTDDDLIEFIVGRRLGKSAHVARDGGASRLLSIRDLSGTAVNKVSFQIRRSEIVGLTGLLGDGFESVPYLLAGARKATSGSLVIENRQVELTNMSPLLALRLGIGLVPASRERDGAVMALTVRENVTLPRVNQFFLRLRMDYQAERKDVGELVQAFDVRPPETERAFGTLSGGNQQKAIIAKWLSTKPRLLLLHEPTQGVDVGARREIHGQIRKAADRGAGVLIASIEYEELAGLCDRVLIMQGGRIRSELTHPDLTKARILDAVYRVPDDSEGVA